MHEVSVPAVRYRQKSFHTPARLMVQMVPFNAAIGAKQTRGFEMTGNTDRLGIRGTSGVVLTGGALIVLLSCLVLSFTVMGTACTRLFLVLLAAVVPLFLLGRILFKAVNWFEFDDDQRRIVRAFGRSFFTSSHEPDLPAYTLR